jgi:prepilin-type N-terminal cleavage/methylation domain-containing protein
MNMHQTHRTFRHASGFSLVEVLIAIFVLALGLLGVAAVFPAVVRQQRQATDTVQGISIQRSVEELLRGNSQLTQKNVVTVAANGNVTINPRGWAVIAGDANFSPRGEWVEANELTSGDPTDSGVTLNTRSGDMFVGIGTAPNVIELPLAERLIPRPSAANGIEPRFVWDFVARRVNAGERPLAGGSNVSNFFRFDDDTLQLAVFVRRIDSGIRVTGNQTLGGVLSETNRRVVPVAEDADGRPTFDGVGRGTAPRYSPIRSGAVEVTMNTDTSRPNLNIVTIPTTAVPAAIRPYLEQLGQKFVDARGIVHEVIRVNRDVTPTQLTIDPPLEQGVAMEDGAVRPATIFFTSQVPASVSVVTIRR